MRSGDGVASAKMRVSVGPSWGLAKVARGVIARTRVRWSSEPGCGEGDHVVADERLGELGDVKCPEGKRPGARYEWPRWWVEVELGRGLRKPARECPLVVTRVGWKWWAEG